MCDGNEDEFPPYPREVEGRLSNLRLIKELQTWTCDQAAQVLSGIDENLVRSAVDNFMHYSEVLESYLIAGGIDTFESKGKKYLKPLAVLEWALSKDHELPASVLILYKKKQNEHNKLTAPVEKERELTEWLREIWRIEGRPNGKPFFMRLKKYVNQKGSPITQHYHAGPEAGIEWEVSSGKSGNMKKKTILNKASLFKKTSLQNTVNSNLQEKIPIALPLMILISPV